MPNRRASDNEVVNRWYHIARPYWHVFSFIVIITFCISIKYSNYTGIAEAHEARISKLELWQSQATPDLAAIRQEVHDIHERIVK